MSETDKYNLTVHHPTVDSRSWEMELDGTHTPAAIVEELISEQHLTRTPEGYRLAVKDASGGRDLHMDQSLATQKVAQDAHLRVIPATKAGGEQK
jgi:hypothetical protein